jgi:hypothetical protein
MRTLLLALVLAIVPFAEVQAAPPPAPAAENSALKTMIDCRKLPTKDARADCYDAAIDSLSQAQAEGKVVVIDREKIQTVRRQAFGFSLPSLSLLSKGLKDEPISTMSLKVTSAFEGADGNWVISTAEGPVWRQTQSSGFSLTPHDGSTLNIHPGVLGAFFCQVDKQAEFRCRRDK